MADYVHGYTETESQRLEDQANTLAELLLAGIRYPSGSRVLEAGCGTGAQTVTLAKNNPSTVFVSMDISQKSIVRAGAAVATERLKNVAFHAGDIFNLPYEGSVFDHIFVCFVLEHLSDPVRALSDLGKVLRKGGTMTVIEGDHGSFYCYPESVAAKKAVQCLIDIQSDLQGNSLIGRSLYPLMSSAGMADVAVTPKLVYVDDSKPDLVEGFSKKTFIAMVEGVREQAVSQNYIDAETWQRGIADLYRATRHDGTFNYTFFKAIGYKK